MARTLTVGRFRVRRRAASGVGDDEALLPVSVGAEPADLRGSGLSGSGHDPLVSEPGERRLRLPDLSITSRVPTYAGLVLAALGFLIIAFGWNQVADTTNVGRQMPYVLSAGLTGIGLVAVGVATVSFWARHQDAAERHRQLDELASAINELSDRLGQGSK